MAKRSEKKYQFWSSQLDSVFIQFHLVTMAKEVSFFFKVVILSTSLHYRLYLIHRNVSKN